MDEQPLRVVMIGPFGLAPKGTMRSRALPLARELVARGHRVTLLMPPWHTPEAAPRRWQEDGVDMEYVALGPRLPAIGHVATTLRLVRRALALRPHIAHCFKPKAYAGLAGWALWHLSRLGLSRMRLLVDEDDWEGPGGWNELEPYPRPMRALFAWQERWGLRHAHAVTVASRALQSITWSLGVPPRRVFYLPNGGIPPVSTGDIAVNRAAVRQSHALGDDPVILLYTRFFEFGVSRAVAVYRRVLKEAPAARLLVVGRALFERDEFELDRLIAEAGLGERVARAGWVQEEDLPSYFAAADVALYPMDDTLVNRTKCPVKLVDLLGAGVPVIADAVGQAAEYVQHGETGLLATPGDAEAMAAAIVRLLRDEPLRHRLGQQARDHAMRRYSWPILADTLLRAYHTALAE
jgi:glycosyltransferase involved in cell wall biosynthesis